MKQVTNIILPNVQASMCGVYRIEIYPSGFTRLHYTDNTTEGANLTQAQLAESSRPFSLVSAVQSCRPNTLEHKA